MFLKTFDIISPKVTLYYKGEKSHTSIISGIITIIGCFIILILGIIDFVNCLKKKNPTAYYFNRYIEDIGDFYINKTSLFNYIQLINMRSREPVDIDYDKIEIIGINVSLDTVITKNYNLEKFYHWYYGKCDDYIGNNENKITNEILNKTACIKKFFDYKTKKYFDVNDANFVNPVIKRGASHPNLTIYGIIIKKCEDNDFRKNNLGVCSSEEDINNYIKNIYISFTIVDNYIDVLNNIKPINNFLYSITDSISSDSYSVNNINFNPTVLKSYQDLILDNYVEEHSYSFKENSKTTTKSENTKILNCFFFWIQNSQQYYERHYQKISEVLSNIGGYGSAIFLISKLINIIVNRYIIILDTHELIFNSNKSDFSYEILMKRRSLRDFIGEGTFINIKKPKIKKSEKPPDINKEKKEFYEEENSKNIIKTENKNKSANEFIDSLTNSESNNNRISNIKEQNKNENANNKNIFTKESEINDKNEEFNWCAFLCHLMHLRKNNPKNQYYEELRQQIISEECLFNNYLNILYLLRINNIYYS